MLQHREAPESLSLLVTEIGSAITRHVVLTSVGGSLAWSQAVAALTETAKLTVCLAMD